MKSKNKTAIEFLREKKILADDKTQWIVKFESGIEIDICDLFTEFKTYKKKEPEFKENEFIGKKCNGFEFKDFNYGPLVFNPSMKKYIGSTATISSFNPDNNSFKLTFDDGDFWHYPAEVVMNNIID